MKLTPASSLKEVVNLLSLGRWRLPALALASLMLPWSLPAATTRTVVVWSEGTANVDAGSKEVYPNDINSAIADGLKPLEAHGWKVVLASLKDPDQGLPDDLLNQTDVLIWWGHKKHGEVSEALVSRIEARVKDGRMGFISTHSSHFAKPYKRLMGTACSWREYKADGTSVEILVADPTHPVCRGVRISNCPKSNATASLSPSPRPRPCR